MSLTVTVGVRLGPAGVNPLATGSLDGGIELTVLKLLVGSTCGEDAAR